LETRREQAGLRPSRARGLLERFADPPAMMYGLPRDHGRPPKRPDNMPYRSRENAIAELAGLVAQGVRQGPQELVAIGRRQGLGRGHDGSHLLVGKREWFRHGSLLIGGGSLRELGATGNARAMYWCCGQLDGRRERLALHGLGLAGYEVYVPRVRAPRRVEALFPSYVFISITLQWHAARWAPGMLKLIMAGDQTAHVPDTAIAELHARERDGLVILPSQPRFRPGDLVRVTAGPLVGFRGLVDGLRPQQRIAVLLELLGSVRAIEMAADDIVLE
jgi:transcription antitermination factor NusG